MEVVINKKHGGFGVSPALIKRALKEGRLGILEVHNYGDESFTKDWDDFINKELTIPYGKGYMTNPGGYYIYSPINRVLYSFNNSVDRHHPDLVALVKDMGKKADGEYAALKIVEIPDDIKYTVEEYDGAEWIAEEHRTWA